jgi:hypothetical protein
MFKDAVQYSPYVNNIEFYSKTIYIFMILEYDKLKFASKGRRFESHRGQAYFSSLPGVDIHSE